MSRKPTKRKAVRHRGRRLASPDERALNQWCIEEAIRWPTHPYLFGPDEKPRLTGDVDLIGRAKKIRDWVTAK